MEHRVSVSQLEALIGFLGTDPELAKGGVGLGIRSKENTDRKWDELAMTLNACGTGATKSGARWRRYWIDLKHRVKSRAAQYRQDATGTARLEDLSELDKRVLAILGEAAARAAAFGDTEHRVPLFGTIVSEPTHNVKEEPAEILLDTSEPIASTSSFEPAPQTESEIEMATSSGSDATSPVRRPMKRRRRFSASPTRSKFEQSQRVSNDWVVELEERRVEAEGKLASAALIMAEASKVQAEASRTQAEAALMQVQVAKEMSSSITRLIEMLEK